MTKILIPIPQTPLGVIRKDRYGNLYVEIAREWYRYLSLLQEASGGDTGIVNNEVLSFSADSSLPSDPLAPFDLGGQAAGEIQALQEAVNDLNPQGSPGPVEMGRALGVLDRDIPFPMPPTELGSMEAAKNIGHRVVAAGNAVLVGGTVTVSNVNADSANEWSLTTKVVGGTQGMLSVGTVTANTSFVVNSSNVADISTVSWVIFAPVKG